MNKNKPVLCIQVDEKTQLCLIETRHAEELFALVERNRDHLREWIDVKAYDGPIEKLREFIQRMLLNFANGQDYPLGIWYEGRLIGNVNYNNLDWRSKKGELGYWIDSAMQGKGIITQCSQVLIDYAFEELGLNKIVISCATGNTRSRAVPERLGFILEGIHRQDDWQRDHYDDIVYYGLLASEWKERKKKN
jgi:ribosomal-protein-serine acetyltransferase